MTIVRNLILGQAACTAVLGCILVAPVRLPGQISMAVVDSNPAKPARCYNEPPGMTPVSSQPWDAVPPNERAGGKDHGWKVTAGYRRLTTSSDPTAPLSAPAVLEGKFPQGMRGGGGPFHIELSMEPARVLYQCFAIKLSPGFTNNRNVGTKLAFVLNPHSGRQNSSQAYINLFNGRNDRGNMGVYVEAPNVRGRLNRDMVSRFAWGRSPAQWHVFEVLMTVNSQGRRDGSLKFWVDGTLDVQNYDVAWFVPTADPVGFSMVDITPTYGGGHNPVPADQFIYIDHWYVSGTK